jgi:hypothetical protein
MGRFGKNSGPEIPGVPPGKLDPCHFWLRNHFAKAWDLMRDFPVWQPGDPNELFFPVPVTIKRIYDNGDVHEWNYQEEVARIRARVTGKPKEVGYSYKNLHHDPVPPRQYKDGGGIEDAEFESLNTENHEAAVEIPVEGECEVVFA